MVLKGEIMLQVYERYGFHDTSINRIEVAKNNLIFNFYSGIYILNKEGRETKLTPQCKVLLEFNPDGVFSIENHTEIKWYCKNRFKTISLLQLRKMIMKDEFSICKNYCSTFSNSILFNGFIKKYEIDFYINNISDIKIII